MDNILTILKGIRPECDYSNSNDFIKDGLLDSFDVVTLVSELEEKYNVLIDALDIIPENFSTVEKIINLIKRSGGKI